jgi:hypothetical protein
MVTREKLPAIGFARGHGWAGVVMEAVGAGDRSLTLRQQGTVCME